MAIMTETELLERLKKLERGHRRLKRQGVAALVLAAALGAIAATRPVPDKITAHEFDVVDNAGRLRIRMSTTPVEASVELLDAQGNRAASMEVTPWVSFITAGKDGGDVAQLTSSAQEASVSVGYSPDLSAVVAGKSGKALRDTLKSYVTRTERGPSVGMAVLPSGGAIITLQDAEGFSTDLGSTGTVTPATGETQHTSAASIVMFGNDKEHRVIWKAP
jgi:hypothetical protein